MSKVFRQGAGSFCNLVTNKEKKYFFVVENFFSSHKNIGFLKWGKFSTINSQLGSLRELEFLSFSLDR